MNTFVSYAQNHEDTLLWRVLHDVGIGAYVDVGAHSPETDSVTRAFYDGGWSGVNIEPVSALWEELRAARPRDVNLRLAVGAQRGESDFFEIPGTGLSTLDRGLAERHRRAGFAVTATRVSVRPLREIWDEFVRGEVHFLKIDVEGAERDVLAGADLLHQRPWIVVIEATAPLTSTPTHASWEPLLTSARYRFAHTDGLNRYYVAQERVALEGRFAALRPVTTTSSEPRNSKHGAQICLPNAASIRRGSRFSGTASLHRRSASRPPSFAPRASCTSRPIAPGAGPLTEPPRLQRKQWEYVYVLQALALHGLLAAGRRGLGFGCGNEPLPAVIASRGCEIVATDLDPESARGTGSIETGQHARTLDEMNLRGLCEPDLFRRRVSFRFEDMNRISPDLEGFDFLWSTCVFAHLGSIQRGLDFVVNAMACLKPGGLAVHTADFNLSSNYSTLEVTDLAVFRRSDIEALIAALEHAGHAVAPLNLNPGAGPADLYVDLPPYRPEPHIRLRLDRYVVTSLGLIVKRGT